MVFLLNLEKKEYKYKKYTFINTHTRKGPRKTLILLKEETKDIKYYVCLLPCQCFTKKKLNLTVNIFLRFLMHRFSYSYLNHIFVL